ncbi:argininosuccinate synthase-related protein [Paraburkholderia humisilvae]|uniref:argininosuccinate synthase n=1 Tax=Paraburkholderia humisilvae TaxID=627669 RepID=A0A6J5FAT4_9BURK|nr:argininosuccinate synthase-related protein [Paraburkholderia humisilvae]CAB3774335.1 Argininosuccinate synthase [Paraburkholderia humisilvae]
MSNQNLIRSMQDLEYAAQRTPRILTMFSGGLDSTLLLKLLAQSGGCEVIALTVDVGDDIDRAELNSLAAHFGARSVVVDARDDFARIALSALHAGAKYMNMYPVSSSLSRPLMARHAVALAEEYGCGAICHTANYSQNSLRRLNTSIKDLGYRGFFGTPYEFSVLSREEKIQRLITDFPGRFRSRSTSGDANLWCREFESGQLDDPENFSLDPDLFRWTAETSDCPKNDRLSVRFEGGLPVELNGIPMPQVELIEKLNFLAGRFGIGRYVGLEHLEGGEKVLEAREAPAEAILSMAFSHLKMATQDAELLRETLPVGQLWLRECLEGRYYGKLRKATERFVEETASAVTGTVTFNLRAGAADACSIVAADPIYLTDRDAWEKQEARVRSTVSLGAMQDKEKLAVSIG